MILLLFAPVSLPENAVVWTVHLPPPSTVEEVQT
jgi:hypothetical protein